MHQTKRKFLTAAMAAITLMAGAIPVFAQRGGRGDGGNRLDFLAGYLSLTDAQKTQAQAIFDAASTASITAQGQLTSAHDAVETAVKANASDSELDSPRPWAPSRARSPRFGQRLRRGSMPF